MPTRETGRSAACTNQTTPERLLPKHQKLDRSLQVYIIQQNSMHSLIYLRCPGQVHLRNPLCDRLEEALKSVVRDCCGPPHHLHYSHPLGPSTLDTQAIQSKGSPITMGTPKKALRANIPNCACSLPQFYFKYDRFLKADTVPWAPLCDSCHIVLQTTVLLASLTRNVGDEGSVKPEGGG